MPPLPLVLIVDDNPENLTVIGELLQPGHTVRAANAGARALKLAALAPQPDLILLDVMMPDMDGYEVLAQLRARPETAEVPVIFLSALNSSADEERGLMLGAADYITKPIRPAVLLARVRTQLELRRARGLLRAAALPSADAARATPLMLAGMHACALLAELRAPGSGGQPVRLSAVLARLLQHWQQRVAGEPRLHDAQLAALMDGVALHDIGKLALPEQLLGKPGPLNDAERAQMRSHVQLGVQALQQAMRRLQLSDQVSALVLQLLHSLHERWDGQGYPQRLAGTEIALPARLMAVAQVFTALVSARPWRAAMTPDEARAVVRQERGGHFDPQVVDVFDAAFDDIVQALALADRPGAAPEAATEAATEAAVDAAVESGAADADPPAGPPLAPWAPLSRPAAPAWTEQPEAAAEGRACA